MTAAVDKMGPRAAKLLRIWALIRKEGLQVVRDPSSFAIGIVLPLILILLYGYGVTFDVKHVPVAIVVEAPSPDAADLTSGFSLSPYFSVKAVTTLAAANELMLERKVDGIVFIREDFARQVRLSGASVQVILHGTDANRARIMQAYAQGALAQAGARAASEGGQDLGAGPVSVQSRLWFNDADDSHYYLVPGLIVLVMTLIGATLTAMVMAREWERGTLEALFVTPVRADEIMIGKLVPYFLLGLCGLGLCMLAAKFLFMVPFRGSVWVLGFTSMLYLLVTLGVGLLISTTLRSQFLASQITQLVTFLPATMLSGFIYDLRSVPAVIRVISYGVPARYFVALLQTIFLAGDVWSVILPNALMLGVMATVLLTLTRRAIRKSLE
ncbi:MAG: ABC transporter permease [Caulobacteraceae bacterium]|nr:ABC transporter permease [Caulobacteraceae bacterium]